MSSVLQADSLTDLNALIGNLYLENNKIDAVVGELEVLVSCHQALVNQALPRNKELAVLEYKILWLLGFKHEQNRYQ